MNAQSLSFSREEAILVIDDVRPLAEVLWGIEVDGEYEGPDEFSTTVQLVTNWDFIPLEIVDKLTDKDIAVYKGELFQELYGTILEQQ